MKRLLAGMLVLFTLICTIARFGFGVDFKNQNAAEPNTVAQNTGKPEKKKKTKDPDDKRTGSSSFTFVGVGDDLIHGALWWRQELAGQGYNFDSYYELTNPYTQAADLAFINQETVCAGNILPFSHYPSFNSPTEILDSVARAGFDWTAMSSNHTLDAGVDALLYHLQYMKDTYPEISVTGSHMTEEESHQYIVRDVNGIKVGLLGYTYGMNTGNNPEDMPWLVEIIDEDAIREDMEALSQISDVQIVSMHWGTEYDNGINEMQQKYAKLLNELGVEVIIGTHPHVIEPAEIYHGEDQDTLIYYSLGNFLSAQDTNYGMVGGMASFTLNYDFDTLETTFEDVKFIPTITYLDYQFYTFKTTTIHEYTDDYVPDHYVTTQGYDMSKEWVIQYVQDVMGNPEGIEIVLS